MTTAKGRVPTELLEKIKGKVNIVEVIGEHVVLKKSGSNHSGLCPFHSERTPSFSVNENKGVYHCFGCKKGGDIFSFVMELHGLNFPEAVEELAERARIPIPRDWERGPSSGDPETEKKRAAAREKLQLAHKLNRFVAAYYHQQLPNIGHAARYFARRGIQGDVARNFYIGAAPGGWDALTHHLAAKKAPLPLAVELGLIRPSKNNPMNPPGKSRPEGPGYFDLFRNRAMFPILDIRGRISGFGGRSLPSPETGEADSPKYLNSPDSFLFQKGKLLYGLYQAQKHIREKDEVVLVEGYFDVLALHMAGFENTVATCGTALTQDHLNVLRRLGTKITVLFDGDKAGIAATDRAMEIGLEQGIVLYGTLIPDELDPDEVLFDQEKGSVIPGGQERMKSILESARPLLDVRIEEAIRTATQGPEARAQALKRISGWLARFNDPVGREIRMQAVETQLQVPRKLLLSAMEAGSRPQAQGGNQSQKQVKHQVNPVVRPKRESQPSPPPTRPAKITAAQKILLGAVARGTEFSAVFETMRSEFPPGMTFSDLFENLPARQFVHSVLDEPDGSQRFQANPEAFLSGEQDSQVRSIITEALLAPDAPCTETELKQALYKRLAAIWARFSQLIKRALAAAETNKDAKLQATLMKEYLDVQRKMKEFNSFYDEA